MNCSKHTQRRTRTVLPTKARKSLRLLRYPYLAISILLFTHFNQPSFADQLLTKNGHTFEGELIGMKGGYISLQESKSGSTSLAIRRFTLEETIRIIFSDADKFREASEIYDNGHLAKAIPLFESLAFRRLPFLGILSPNDEQVFSDLLLCYSLTGLYEKCLNRHKLWHRKFVHRTSMEDSSIAAMRASWEAGLKDEAALFARRWMEDGNSSTRSAIAWRILAELESEKENHEQALWISLQPIAFADRNSPDQLDVCYEIARVAATKIGDPTLSETLARDMMPRGFLPKNAIPAISHRKPKIIPSDSPNPHKLVGNP